VSVRSSTSALESEGRLIVFIFPPRSLTSQARAFSLPILPSFGFAPEPMTIRDTFFGGTLRTVLIVVVRESSAMRTIYSG
jgi:hypothetical protein